MARGKRVVGLKNAQPESWALSFSVVISETAFVAFTPTPLHASVCPGLRQVLTPSLTVFGQNNCSVADLSRDEPARSDFAVEFRTADAMP
jgi:hypothetical protein